MSSIVPEPMTRVGGTPPGGECAARCVMMSTGLETTTSTASGACSSTDGTSCAEDGGVPLEELESRLARRLGAAGGDHHRATAGQIGVASGTHRQRMREGDRVQDVGRVRLGAFPIRVDEHELAADPAHHQRERGGRAHHSAAYDSDLHAFPQVHSTVVRRSGGGLAFRAIGPTSAAPGSRLVRQPP